MDRSPEASRLRSATTTGAWLHVLIRTLAAHGLDGTKLAIEAGVAPRNIRHPDERVSQLAMSRFWGLAVKATGNPSLGLDAARFVTGSTFGALSHAAFVSPTLEHAFRRVVRHQRLMTDSLDLELTAAKDRLRLTARAIAPNHPPAEELDAFWATWVRGLRDLAPKGQRVEPIRIHRRRARPSNAALFDKVFGTTVRFRAAEDFVEYDREICQVRLPEANLELAQEYDQILVRHTAKLENATVAEKVRAVLFEIMADRPTESTVATQLFMSRSALKASLSRESTSYREILDDVRRTLACRYLEEKTFSIKEIAFLLGYADASVFSRAFKRWTGKTPGRYA